MQNRDEFDDLFDESYSRQSAQYGQQRQSLLGRIFPALTGGHVGQGAKPVLAATMFFGLATVLGVVLWMSYPKSGSDSEIVAAPIIRADASPIKAAPEDKGGMVVPFQESTIFETLEASNEFGGEPENLLDSEEQSMAALDDQASALNAVEPAAGAVGYAMEDYVDVAERLAREKTKVDASGAIDITARPVKRNVAVIEQEQVASVPSPVAKPVITAKVDDKKSDDMRAATELSKVEPAAGVQEFKERKPLVAGTHFVQLGSLRSEEAAKVSWSRLQDQFPAELENLNLNIQQADLGERGMYYRVQAGPISKLQAGDVCRAVEAKKPGGCLVVKR